MKGAQSGGKRVEKGAQRRRRPGLGLRRLASAQPAPYTVAAIRWEDTDDATVSDSQPKCPVILSELVLASGGAEQRPRQGQQASGALLAGGG